MLRRSEASVEDLASKLGLTDNAVRAQLESLQEAGVVTGTGVRRDGTVGKPAVLYGIAPAASESLFSSAYGPVLAAVLAELGSAMQPEQLRAVLRNAGRRIAPAPVPRTSLESRVREGAALLVNLGGDVEVVARGDGFVIQGFGCPLSQAVSACPEACAAVETLLAETTGATVRERCDRAGPPHCHFVID